MERPLFEHRHFAWLAAWAADNLDANKRTSLCHALSYTNPNFDVARFLSAAQGKPHGRDQAWRNDMRGLESQKEN